jgi:hypothetical protein
VEFLVINRPEAADPCVMTALTTSGTDGGRLSRPQSATVRNLIARALGVKTDGRNWGVAADAEEKVGRRLASLPHGWHHLHAIPVGDAGSDIDHLVIGPGGVFALDAKHHPGGAVWLTERGVRVNGQSMPYLHKSRSEAEQASKLLTVACSMPVTVQAVVVFIDIEKLVVRGTPNDVAVTTCRELRRFLTKQPVRLSQLTADHIFVMARSNVTWQSLRLTG